VDSQSEDLFEVCLLIRFNWWFDEEAKVSTTTNTLVVMIVRQQHVATKNSELENR
jgi:hypothetical protein